MLNLFSGGCIVLRVISCIPPDAAAVYRPDESSHARLSGNRMRGAGYRGIRVNTATNSPLIPARPGGNAAAVYMPAPSQWSYLSQPRRRCIPILVQ